MIAIERIASGESETIRLVQIRKFNIEIGVLGKAQSTRLRFDKFIFKTSNSGFWGLTMILN